MLLYIRHFPKKMSTKRENPAHASESPAKKSACANNADVDLIKLVELLIPAYLKRKNEFTITHAQITPDAPVCIAGLSMEIYRKPLLEHECSSPAAFGVTASLLRDKNTGDMAVNVTLTPKNSTHFIKCDVQRDLDAFERAFEEQACGGLSIACDVIGHGAVIPCILLCMLVYTEHVFDPLSDECDDDGGGGYVKRTQRTAPHADATRKMLGRYWDMDKAYADVFETDEGNGEYSQLIYPFLVRLMTPEFAMESACEDMINELMFFEQEDE